MKYFLMPFIFFTSLTYAQYGEISVDDYIQDPEMFEENQLPVLPTLIPFEDRESALHKHETESGFYQSLNGEWKFSFRNTPYVFPEDFYKKDFDDSGWDVIKVPSVWQMQGYDHLMYRNIPMEFYPYDPPNVPVEINPSGCYRKKFTLKNDWKGRRVILHFDGVKSNAFVWINGKYTGYDEGGMTSAEFDITNLLNDQENQITVLVTRWSDGSYLEDQDMWRYSGIFRDIYIYSKPEVSISDLTIVTDFDNEYKNADLKLKVAVDGRDKQEKYSIRYSLYDEQAEIEGTVPLPDSDLIEIKKNINEPKQWSDEKPFLYTLLVELLNSGNEVIEIIKEKVGFRELEIINSRACLNGKPFYIRGVNRHEHHPVYSGAITKDMMIKDIFLMKQNNINAVRTSHYPDSPLWYELCDEYGILLQDEVNAECHYKEDWIPTLGFFHKAFMNRFISMVQRDKNHPSVIMWSTGNECGLAEIHFRMNQYARENDGTRFIMHQSNNPDGDAPYADLNGPRYPTVSRLFHTGLKSAKPVVMGEYAHAMGNSLGHFDRLWELIYSTPKLQGGFIWDWVDQGLNIDLKLTPEKSSYIIKSAVIGNPELIEGRKGKALKLSGLDDWVEVYNHPVFDSLHDNLSIEFYLKPGKWFLENPLVTRSNQFGITQRHPDSLTFYINDYKNSVTTAVPPGWRDSWHTVKAEYNGKIMQLSVDDKIKVNKNYDRSFRFTQYPVNIGRDISRNTDQHLGWISNCAFDELVISADINNKKTIILNLPFDEINTEGKFTYYGASSFVCNGIIFNDRTPQPELFQVKKSHSPVRFELQENKIFVNSFYGFTNLNEFDFNWYLYKNGNPVKSGSFKVDCPPFERSIINSPVKKTDLAEDGEYILEVTMNTRKPEPWAEPGEEITFEQFILSSLSPREMEYAEEGKVNVEESGGWLTISSGDYEFRINKRTGELEILHDAGVLITGPELNVWRAPISNEKVDWGEAEAAAWFSDGLNRLILDSTDFKYDESFAQPTFTLVQYYRLPENVDYIISRFVYTFRPDGKIKINHKVDFIGYFNYAWLPRIGMKFKTSKLLQNVSWYGRGPFETYPDRKSGAKIGLHHLAVDSFYVPYVQPENYGNRTDVRSLQLYGGNETGLSITCDNPFNFSITPYEGIERAVYPFQLQKRDDYILSIDYKITGVGDTPVPVLPEYRVYPVSYNYSVILSPGPDDIPGFNNSINR